MLKISLQRGFTLVEMMIALAIVALVLFVAVPSFTIFLQNQQIKNAANSALDGLTFARAEAIRLNTPVRFQFVTDLTSGCTLSSTSLAWVVSQTDPTGLCDKNPADGAPPGMIQKRPGTEGMRNAVLAEAGGTSVTFTGLGRALAGGMTKLDFSNPNDGGCEYINPASGKMRCMRIMITSGGQARMCDPQVTDPNDPRKC